MMKMIFPLLLAIAFICVDLGKGARCPPGTGNYTLQTSDQEHPNFKTGLLRGGPPVDFCEYSLTDMDIPKEFDARKMWPHCSDIIGHIRNQGQCGSCWAVATAAVISDRICIQSGGLKKVSISALDIMACHNPKGYGCNEGRSGPDAFRFWLNEGVVSGGDFGDDSTCLPYPYVFLNEGKMGDHSMVCFSSYECKKQCVNKKDYSSDKHFGKAFCRVKPNEEAIQREIMTFGSVWVSFDAFGSIYNVTSEIYCEPNDEELPPISGHAIKLFGWGVTENGDKYWLAANSWGTNWGDKGFFKFFRGINNCRIESEVYSLYPLLN